VQDKNAVEKGERFVSLEREQFRCRGATVWIGIAFAPQSAPKVFIGMMANRTLTFDRITTFDPYYFPPGLRFLYIAVVSCVLLIALWFKFVMLGIGGYLLNSVETEPRVGLVIGLLIGAGSDADRRAKLLICQAMEGQCRTPVHNGSRNVNQRTLFRADGSFHF
jgi:hypothetical protein